MTSTLPRSSPATECMAIYAKLQMRLHAVQGTNGSMKGACMTLDTRNVIDFRRSTHRARPGAGFITLSVGISAPGHLHISHLQQAAMETTSAHRACFRRPPLPSIAGFIDTPAHDFIDVSPERVPTTSEITHISDVA